MGSNNIDLVSSAQIQVSNQDGSPAHNVPVKVNLLDSPLTVFAGAARATVNMPKDNHPQTITVSTPASLLFMMDFRVL